MEDSGIGVSNLPNQRYRSIYKKSVRYNLMILGSKGLGKTTFINNIFGTDLEYNHSKEIKHTFLVNENSYTMKLTITELDSINESTDNTHISEEILFYIKEELKKFKENVDEKKEDNRIHAIIYFFEPLKTGIKESDLRIMRNISKYSNFIPVVAKSDLLNCDINSYRSFLIARLKEEGVRMYDTIYFLINGYKNENEFVRVYNWGALLTNNVSFNDFLQLKKVLLTRKLVDLVEKVEFYFISYQTEEILKNLDLEEIQ